MNLRPVASDSLVRRIPDPGYGPKRLPAATEPPKVENPLLLTLNLVAIEIAGLIALWHALGLIGEPVAALKQALPFFGRR